MKKATLGSFLLAAATTWVAANGQTVAPNSTAAPTTAAPTTAAPTGAPTNTAIYEPGNLGTFLSNLNLYVSQGMQVRVIARTDYPVAYDTGGQSAETFHAEPDGAAVFADDSTGGWVYVSNSEVDNNGGGVGAIKFDAEGNIIDYKRLLTGTKRNCNGGKTQWNTWISCEESNERDGVAWQVDPFGLRDPVKITLGSTGGTWEAFAHDTRDPSVLHAFLSEDEEDGAVERMTLSNPNYTDPWNILLQPGPVDYLFLDYPGPDGVGVFRWITDQAAARENAHHMYQNGEGLEMVGEVLTLVPKTSGGFYRLNLDTNLYTFEYVGFEGQPDQITTVTQEDGSTLTYFTEEAAPVAGCLGQQVGIHTRNDAGEYSYLIYGYDTAPETTGIAFSPDGMFMYFAYQSDGILYEAKRVDGLSFHAQKAPSTVGCGLARTVTNSVKSLWRGSALRRWWNQ